MITSLLGGTGTVVLRIAAPTPSVVMLHVHDASGRLVTRRRLRDLRTALTLPTGRHRLTVTDDRSLHDPYRHAGTVVDVEVTEHSVAEQTLVLSRGAVLRAATARYARVTLAHADGERLETRADGTGTVVAAGLRAGDWTLVARDARRKLVSAPLTVSVAAASEQHVTLTADLPTSRLLVRVSGGDRRPVLATEVTLTDATGRTVTAPVRDGLADLSELRPGPHALTVPASVGHLGVRVGVELDPRTLSVTEVVVPVGAGICGRVVQGSGQYAAVVALLDEHGTEVERVRTDEDGRFVIGRGLTSRIGLTVVATTGPETLHVTRAAIADVHVLTGVRHDLGDVVLPVGGRVAVWSARTPAVAGMKLPSTRV